MNKQSIEYFKMTNKGMMIKEQDCPERFLSVREMKKLKEEIVKSKKWEKISNKYTQNELPPDNE